MKKLFFEGTHDERPAWAYELDYASFAVGDRVRVDNIAGQAKPGRIEKLGTQYAVRMEHDGRILMVMKSDLTKLPKEGTMDTSGWEDGYRMGTEDALRLKEPRFYCRSFPPDVFDRENGVRVLDEDMRHAKGYMDGFDNAYEARLRNAPKEG